MNTFEKGKLLASIRHIVIFLKSGKPIYSSVVHDMAYRKMRKRRIRKQSISKHYVFHSNSKNDSSSPEVLKSRY